MIWKITQRLLLLISITLISNSLVLAQRTCGFEGQPDKLKEIYPQYEWDFEKVNQEVEEFLSRGNNLRTEATVYTIPVVVHIIHTGGAVGTQYNPSDAEVQAAIAFINDRYMNSAGGDTEVRFELAKRAPDCSATNGILRVNGSGLTNYTAGGVFKGTTGTPELEVKNLSRWSNNDYYNIWVVNKINGADGTVGSFTAGYAYFPGAASNIDGTVILAKEIKDGANSTTLAHELGHALGLYHTFDGGCSSASTAPGCSTDGDRVCDTKPHTQGNFECFANGTAIPSCGGTFTDNERLNIMSYYSCSAGQQLFTAGQKDRLRATLETQRPGLIVSSGDEAPAGVNLPAAVASAPSKGAGSIGNYFGLSGFKFAGLDSKSSSSGSDGAFYIDRAASCASIGTVEPGNSYAFELIPFFTNTQNAKIYIDFNNDGNFTDAGEDVYTGNNISGNSSSTAKVTGNITIPAGITTGQTVRVRVIVDPTITNSTTIAGSAVPGGTSVGQIEDFAVLVKSPATPTVNLTADKNTSSEGSNTAGRTVTLTATASAPVNGNQTVTLNVSGTNIIGTDYTLNPTAITIISGQTTGTATFVVQDDADLEGDETATISIASVTPGITTGTTTSQNVTIVDNEKPSVNLSVNATSGTEAGTTSITVTATASAAVTGAQTLKVTIGGAGITTTDYNLSGGALSSISKPTATLTIAGGATTGTFNFDILNDADLEGNETATITISVPSNGITLGTTTSQNVTIIDDDKPSVSITVDKNAVNESGNTSDRTVTLTATSSVTIAGTETVDVMISGVGIQGSDYTLNSLPTAGKITISASNTGTATLVIADDSDVENLETLVVTITQPSAGITLGSTNSQNITITDNDFELIPEVALSANATTGTEAAGTVVTITATADAAVSGDQIVDVRVEGFGISDEDFTLSDTEIKILNGQTTGTVTFTVQDDDFVEENQETAFIFIDNPSDGIDIAANDEVFVTITDNDQAGFTVTETSGSTSVTEAGATDQINVVLAKRPLTPVVINVSSNDTGEATVSPVSLTFDDKNWNQAQAVTVTGVDDSLVDGDKTSTVTLSINDNSSNDFFDPLVDQTVNVTTTNNDKSAITLSVSEESATEGGANHRNTSSTLTITATPVSELQQTFNINLGGTNVTSADYLLKQGNNTLNYTGQTITLPANQASLDLVLTIMDDGMDEGLETVNINLSNPSNLLMLGNTVNKTVVLIDNERATWTGTEWLPAPPQASQNSTFDESLQLNQDVTTNNITVTNGSKVEVMNGKTLTINGNVAIQTGGSIIVESGGSILFDNNSTVTQPITFKRNASNKGYSVLSSPIQNADYSNFSGPSTFKYDETMNADNPWINIRQGTIPVGSGFIEFLPSSFSLTGIPNIGPQNIDITVTGNGSFFGFNLVGNPYPAALKLGDFLFGNNNPDINGTLWFWDPVIQDYRPKNLATGDVAFSINSMQGFFVKAERNGKVYFNHNMRVPGENNNFFRQGADDIIRIHLTSSQNEFENDLYLAFAEDFTEDFDQMYDADKFKGNPNFAFYAKHKEQLQSVLALPFIDSDREIELGIDATNPENIDIQLAEATNLPSNWSLYVKESESGQLYPLLSNLNVSLKSNKKYTLVITTKAVSELEGLTTLNSEVSIWDNQEVINVWFADQEVKEAKIHVYTVTGQKVIQSDWKSVNHQNLTFDNKLQPSQIYIIKLETRQGVFTKKIMR